MLLDKKHLQTLQQLKIKHSLDEFPLCSNYLYIDEYKCLFINKFKNKLYQVCASPVCNLSFVDSQCLFNVLYTTDQLPEAVSYWKKSIKEIM